MKRIDLDDLPPKLAALLTGVEPGEEVLLIQNGAVAGRLTGAAVGTPPPTQADPEQPAEDHAKEIFEIFRSSIEDEF